MYKVEGMDDRTGRGVVVVRRDDGRLVCSASIDLVRWMHDRVPNKQLNSAQVALVNWYKAAVHSAAGNPDAALQSLEVALDKEFRDFVNLEASPYFASLRDDPRYKNLIDRYK